MLGTRGAALAWLVVAGLGAGCASGGAGGSADTADEEGSIVQILNVSPGAVEVQVYMMAEVGIDVPLGSIEPGQTREFVFDGQPGRYRIRAVGAAGAMQTEQFQLYRNSHVRWDMSAGRSVRVGARR